MAATGAVSGVNLLLGVGLVTSLVPQALTWWKSPARARVREAVATSGGVPSATAGAVTELRCVCECEFDFAKGVELFYWLLIGWAAVLVIAAGLAGLFVGVAIGRQHGRGSRAPGPVPEDERWMAEAARTRIAALAKSPGSVRRGGVVSRAIAAD